MSAARITRRRVLSALFVAGAGGALLGACGATPTPQVVKETVVVMETTIVEQVVTATPVPQAPSKFVYADYAWNVDLQQQLLGLWNDDHPEMPVEGQFAPWDTYWTKLQTQIAGGDVPDLIDNSIAYIVILAFRNGLLDLDPLMERDQIPVDDFYPGTFDPWRWEYGSIRTGNGPLYGFPAAAQTAQMFYYNKTMFDAEGIAYPDETWDWDKLMEVATAFTKDTDGDGQADQFGLSASTGAYGLWWPFTWQAGGEFYDADMKQCLADQEAAMVALEHIIDIYQGSKVAPLPGSMQSNPFMSGKVAMDYSGMWNATITYLDIKEFDWDVAAPPKGPAGVSTIDIETEPYSIMKQSKHVEEAWTFLKWMMMGDGAPFTCQYWNAGFPYKPIAEQYTYNRDRATAPLSIYMYADLIGAGHENYVAGSWAEFESAATTELQAAVIGEKDAASVAASVVENSNAILADAWKKFVG